MNTPANVIRLFDNGSLDDILNLTKGIRSRALAFLGTDIPLDVLQEGTEVIHEACGVELNRVQLYNLLSLYPIERSVLIDSGMDTEARGALLKAVAQYFLGCEWPNLGEQNKIDFEKFLKALDIAVPKLRPLL
jgi:hypothetical protein